MKEQVPSASVLIDWLSASAAFANSHIQIARRPAQSGISECNLLTDPLGSPREKN